ncbi:unnamed protein product [Cuscuta campestris]|uniref:DUF4408 domain-containing protein n=1 Tax=Cuscuta campestris TaxID=132261 RepID=A0A484LQ51_9ASTE|nr:unnamed protein product [Cuscuta campestris]
MDLYSFNNIKAEKVKAMNKYRRMQKVTAVFRLVEFCFLVFMFSRFSLRFPRDFKFPEVDFRGILGHLISPRVLFVVGNAIVIVLYRKSKGGSSCSGDGSGEMEKQSISVREEEDGVSPAKCIKKQGRQSISVSGEEEEEEEETPGKRRKMNRSRSEGRSMGAGAEESGRELRRSATTVKCREKEEEGGGGEEEMSSEEFRKKVEDFIARQQRLLREEEFSTFVSCGK